MQVLLLHNPTAGMADHRKDELIAALAAKGMEVSYCSTKDDDFPDCLSRNVDMVVIAGGDGTVAKAVTNLPDRTHPLGVIPLGGSNNVATSLGFDRGEMLDGDWPKGTTAKKFHIGCVRGPWGEKSCLEGVGFGALAASLDTKAPPANSAREKLLNGRRLFANALAQIEPIDVDVIVDGDVVAGRWLMAEALTMSHSGPRLPLAPQAKGLEGQFSVLLLEADRRADMLEWLNKPERAEPPARVMAGRSVSFCLDHKTPLRIDDSTKKAKGHRIELEIEDEPLRILVPNGLQR
ncbi:diacylglycerol/lipid kinase family protein [Chelativorans sp. YIM 93263]|uniref:diacylglycerol/lipid kinase family protein n=1 Tax=Chelativorans sp. YIM 93263 TaxID=2906648 RepID=UPI0023788ACC|nr:diacylglycerol kinase family protein [Chelativorans sp. YIM 93263]